MECKYCGKEIGDRDPEECMANPHRQMGDPSTDTRPEYNSESKKPEESKSASA